MVYERSFTTTGRGAGSPCRIALVSNSTSCGVKPARAVTAGSTLKTCAGPLIVLSIPSRMSTTPGIFLIAAATWGAQTLSSAGSWLKSLITTGSGALVKSPIMSCSNCGNSTSSTGSAFLILARTSAITSSPLRLRSFFSLTEISPVLASVTCASPNCSPVRREVLSTSGVLRRMFST